MQAQRSHVSPSNDADRLHRGATGPVVPVMIGLAAFAVGALMFFKPSETAVPSSVGTSASSTATAPAKPARPALTAEEERYIRSLWPIHGDVQRSSLRVGLGQIFYSTKDLGAPELKARVEQALGVYKSAQSRMQALEPPPSLRAQHDDYLAAVRLFEESALEVMKMFSDGREDHLLAAHPKGQAGADKIREIGGRFWPNEFAPH